MEQSLDENLAMVVVRFFPSFGPESQLVLKFTESGGEAVFLKLDVALGTLDQPITADKLDEAAKRITYKRRSLPLQLEASNRMLDQLWEVMTQSPDKIKERLGLLQLDGTRYEIRIFTSLTSVSMVVLDDEAYDDRITGNVPIVRWLNNVRVNIAK